MKKQIVLNLLVLLFVCPIVSAQNITITGTVKDLSNEPIVGVVVYVPGTMNYAITGLYGEYTISCQSGATLVFSCLGYVEQRIMTVVCSTTINVIMEEDPTWGQLQEFPRTGYCFTDKFRKTATCLNYSPASLRRSAFSATWRASMQS